MTVAITALDVALASAIAAGIAALASLLVTWVVSREARKHEETLAAGERDHALKLVREERG